MVVSILVANCGIIRVMHASPNWRSSWRPAGIAVAVGADVMRLSRRVTSAYGFLQENPVSIVKTLCTRRIKNLAEVSRSEVRVIFLPCSRFGWHR